MRALEPSSALSICTVHDDTISFLARWTLRLTAQNAPSSKESSASGEIKSDTCAKASSFRGLSTFEPSASVISNTAGCAITISHLPKLGRAQRRLRAILQFTLKGKFATDLRVLACYA